ncbi:MAG: hypothetical protein L3J24_12055 [Xanthomonadales bacterium]|nr:hypothetical protein [Xanthomonadales bacterium]
MKNEYKILIGILIITLLMGAILMPDIFTRYSFSEGDEKVGNKNTGLAKNNQATVLGESNSSIGRVARVNLDHREKLSSASTSLTGHGEYDDSIIDQDYKESILSYLGPIEDVLPEMMELADMGDSDAEFKLINISGIYCGLIDGFPKDEDVCPDKLGSYIGDATSISSLYQKVRELAGRGGVWAMIGLQDFVPPPFKDRNDFEQNWTLRARNSEIVTEHYQSVRKYLSIAANGGHPKAMRRLADLYMAGYGIMDPDRKEAAFWLIASSELSGNIISSDTQETLLNPIATDELDMIQKRAVSFAEKFK